MQCYTLKKNMCKPTQPIANVVQTYILQELIYKISQVVNDKKLSISYFDCALSRSVQ